MKKNLGLGHQAYICESDGHTDRIELGSIARLRGPGLWEGLTGLCNSNPIYLSGPLNLSVIFPPFFQM